MRQPGRILHAVLAVLTAALGLGLFFLLLFSVPGIAGFPLIGLAAAAFAAASFVPRETRGRWGLLALGLFLLAGLIGMLAMALQALSIFT